LGEYKINLPVILGPNINRPECPVTELMPEDLALIAEKDGDGFRYPDGWEETTKTVVADQAFIEFYNGKLMQRMAKSDRLTASRVYGDAEISEAMRKVRPFEPLQDQGVGYPLVYCFACLDHYIPWSTISCRGSQCNGKHAVCVACAGKMLTTDGSWPCGRIGQSSPAAVFEAQRR
jgi:hypothetical protein